MRKILFIAFIYTIISLSSKAQTTFQRVYGGAAMDNGNSVRKTTDNGFIIAGTTTSFGSGGRDVLVIKTNAIGDTAWTRTFGGATDNEYGFCAQQTTDGGYIVSGVASSFADVAGDMYLIKLTAAGDTIWTRTYGGIGYEWGAFVQQTTDGGYIVVGQTPAFGAGGFDAYLVKLNAAGDISWTKTYGGTGLEIGSAVQQTSDGGYILTGQIDSYGAGFGDFYLIKTDASGNVVWTRAYGVAGEEAGVSVKQTTDGGFIIGGTSENTGPLGKDMCLIKTNSLGDTLWAKIYGGPLIDECNEVIQTADGGYIMCGRSFSFSVAGDYDIYVVKTDNQGTVQWSKTYGSSASASDNEFGYSIQQTNDGGYIITGETWSFGLGPSNVYLIKTDALGNSGCNQATPVTITSNLLPQVIAPPTLTASGGTISYPGTMINSGGTKTTLCEFIPPTCSTPTGGTASTSSGPFCSSGPGTITAAGYSSGSGISYQWQYSNDNFVSNINDLVGQTNPATASTGTITSTTWYRLKVTCSAGPTSSYSNIVSIIVNQVPVQPGAITGNVSVNIGQTLNYSISPVIGATGYDWSISGGGNITAGQNTPQVTINWIAQGNYTLSIKAANACGSSSNQTLNIIVSFPTGVINPDNTFRIKIMPNPSPGEFYLTAKGVMNKDIDIVVSNFLGQNIYLNHVKAGTNDFTYLINLRNVANGIYNVKIAIGKKVYLRTITKQ